VGHRVVHGGPDHSAPERVAAPLLAELQGLVAFAPLHLPSAIQGIEAVTARFPNLPQVACFDTAFHMSGVRLIICIGLLTCLLNTSLVGCGFNSPPVKSLQQWEQDRNRTRSRE